MIEIKQFNRLYSKKNNGKIYIWDICVRTDNEISYICTNVGQIDGKIVEHSKKIKNGKNIGKKNGTTCSEQAILEATSMWKNKLTKNGYRENINNLDNVNLLTPMYAQYFDKRAKYIDYKSAYVQPKLDGVRAIIKKDNNNITIYSKNGLELYNLNHIKSDLIMFFGSVPENIVFDGELYTNNLLFNKINGFVRRKEGLTDTEKREIKKIKFHMFDCFDLKNDKWSFKTRYRYIKELFDRYNFVYETHNSLYLQNLILVKTISVLNEQQIYDYNNEFVNDGYEGIIIRNGKGYYKNNKCRSNDLQKYKLFKDDEFKIVGFEEGTGHDEGTVIWICQINTKNTTFRVRPIGTIEARQQLYVDGLQYIDKMLTVRFQEYSEDGVPRFPVGLRIRDIDW
jgi:DNA ligase-1